MNGVSFDFEAPPLQKEKSRFLLFNFSHFVHIQEYFLLLIVQCFHIYTYSRSV